MRKMEASTCLMASKPTKADTPEFDDTSLTIASPASASCSLESGTCIPALKTISSPKSYKMKQDKAVNLLYASTQTCIHEFVWSHFDMVSLHHPGS